MIGYKILNIDTVTAHLAGLLNGRSAIRHEGDGGKDIMDIYRSAGIEIEEETLLYRTQEEAYTLADTLIAKGKRLFYCYPLPSGRFPDKDLLVPANLWRFLNAKVNLETIVPPEFMPERKYLSCEELDSFEPSGPLFLKAAGDAATAWGYAVHPFHDKVTFDNASRWFAEHRDSVTGVIAEEWADVSICWCAGISVIDSETICFGGAEQLFSSTARQSGSMIDPEFMFPDEGRLLAVRVGEVARSMGYRGIAGLDIGLRNDGRLVVFDPNFRLNASTSQLLFHDSAVARTGHSVTRSFHAEPYCTFKELTKRLEAPIREGWFVPIRIFNGEKHPLSMGQHFVTGFVIGHNRIEAEGAVQLLKARLEV
ncbi:MAG: hypothetical protein JW738_07785 [Actinobacteria bacterium]|nr:hypothetical protein [Actinomycetota bacterium]